METFDPAINYGPNDAGASAVTIALVIIGILLISWLFGATYGLIANLINSRKDRNDYE